MILVAGSRLLCITGGEPKTKINPIKESIFGRTISVIPNSYFDPAKHGGQEEDQRNNKKLAELCKEGVMGQVREFAIKNSISLSHSVNSPIDAVGNVPLHLTVSQNDFLITTLLLLKGADPNIQNQGGVTPLTIAIRMGLVDLANTLIRFGAVPTDQREIKLLQNLKENPISQENTESNAPINHTQGLFGSFSSNKAGKGLKVELLDEELRNAVKASLETGFLILPDAAYLGAIDPIKLKLRIDNMADVDEKGTTMLMKAAYRGHLALVKFLLEKNCDANAMDHYGNTALVWAALNGHVRVMFSLIDYGASIDGAVPICKQQNVVLQGQMTPLIAAAYKGKCDVLEFLIKERCDVNLRCGPGNGRSAIMVAAWSRHIDAVKILIEGKAFVDPNVDSWLLKGVIQMKKAATQKNAWTSFGIELNRNDEKSRRASLQEKIKFLTSEESSQVQQIAKLLVSRAGVSVAKLVNAPKEVAPPPETAPAGDSTILKRRSAATNGRANSKGISKTFRNAINFDKIIGPYSDCVISLSEHIPTTGTELDALWTQLYQCLVQLIMAANKNIKHHYIAISAKLIHCSAEIVRCVENAGRKQNGLQMLETTLYSNIKNLSKSVSSQYPKQLMLSTRMAIGVWPPPDAVAQMIREAASIVTVCRELVGLANILGCFPKLEDKIEVSFQPFDDADVEDQNYKKLDSSLKGGLSYNEYKRQNDLMLIEEMSKKYDHGANDTIEAETQEIANNKFDETFEILLKQFAAAFAGIKSVHENQRAEEQCSSATQIHECAEMILEEIRAYKLQDQLTDEMVITEEDAKELAAKGVKLEWGPFPAALKTHFSVAFETVHNSASILLMKGKMASNQIYTPETFQYSVACAMSVRKLGALAKEVNARIRAADAEERRKQEEWKQECLANERVKKLFQMWESQVLGESNQSKMAAGNKLTAEEIKMLEDSLDGLALEDSSGKVKGGKLVKLVEVLTSHEPTNGNLHLLDQEFLPAFLMTLHSFTTSTAFLEHLMNRYDITPPYGLDQRMFEVYLDKKVVQVRLKVCNVLLHWIQNHFEEDFVDYEFLILRFRDFVSKKVMTDFEQMAVQILDALNAKVAEAEIRIKSIVPVDRSAPKPVTIRNDTLQNILTDPSQIFEIDPLEFARQMTILEFDLYKKVRGYECLDQIWEGQFLKEIETYKLPKSHQNKRIMPGSPSSNISALIQHTNDFTFWIATCVVNHESPKARLNALKYVIQVAQHCKELNNLTGVTTIVAGLSMGPVGRLHRTWGTLQDKHSKIGEDYKELYSLVSPKHQYANYRKFLKEMSLPALPFLGVFLTDLTFIELGNQNFLPESHLINFEKRRKVFNLITDIKKFQVTPYNLVPIAPIQEFMRKLVETKGNPVGWEEKATILTEEELYAKSLEYEPKEMSSEDDLT